MQWLNKWDQFRSIKMKYADRVLDILKSRRRVINIIALITLAKHLQGIQDNYTSLKRYRMGQFTQIIFAIKLKHRYNNVFKRNYGSSYEIRQKNFIRRGLTQMPGAILHPLWEERSK